MRPIKYRAFHKELKIMREVCTLRLDFNEVIVKFEKDGWTDKTTWFEGQFELMQFTGLHDRNGKPIFENDIVRFEVENDSLWCGPRIGVIKFNEDTSSFEILLPKGFLSIGRGYDAYRGTLLIQGNLHETPELLETK